MRIRDRGSSSWALQEGPEHAQAFRWVCSPSAPRALLALAACGGSSQRRHATPPPSAGAARPRPAAAGGKVGVILPDTASSARWETADRPFLEAAFNAAGVESDIQNAGGDKTKFPTHRRRHDQRGRQGPA